MIYYMVADSTGLVWSGPLVLKQARDLRTHLEQVHTGYSFALVLA